MCRYTINMYMYLNLLSNININYACIQTCTGMQIFNFVCIHITTCQNNSFGIENYLWWPHNNFPWLLHWLYWHPLMLHRESSTSRVSHPISEVFPLRQLHQIPERFYKVTVEITTHITTMKYSDRKTDWIPYL